MMLGRRMPQVQTSSKLVTDMCSEPAVGARNFSIIIGLKFRSRRQHHTKLTMGKKRKSRSSGATAKPEDDHRYAPNETFDDSEDEFYTHRDKILLDEAPAAKRRRKIEEEAADLGPSDEEVYADEEVEEDFDDAEDDADDIEDEDEDEQEEREDDSEDERIWGTSRRDYYNADPISTEADALEEEAEARRLQQKQLQKMTEADFGFDENEWATEAKPEGPRRAVVEKLPALQIPEDASKEDKMKILRARYPEFEPLAEELVALYPTLQELKVEVNTADVRLKPTLDALKLRALSAYLASISMYIAILTSSKDGMALPPVELREHPVMDSLLRCRQLWESVQELDDDLIEEEEIVEPPPVGQPKKMKDAVIKPRTKTQKSSKPSKQPKVISPDPSDSELDDYQPLPVKASNKPKNKRTDLNDLISAAAQTTSDDISDFGDEDPLTTEQAAEKARKKKSLRFYTSQIAQKAGKRNAASRAAGGDDDVPYKERVKDRQARLEREAERSRQQAAMDVDDNDDGDDLDDTELVKQINDQSNDYYDTVVLNSKSKKAAKAARAQAFADTAAQNGQVYEQEEVGPDGKRKITYAIAKNKGLTPKRKKDVRNPRVKKKKKYEEKMKKLGSMRPVYKGGEGRGGYGGELTGIKTNVVKSTKL
jgi:U3 small nucleolar RNA-associated protein 3